MKNLKKILCLFIALLMVAPVLSSCGKEETSNDAAQADKVGRYIQIVNDTNQVINDVIVVTDEEVEIEAMRRKNPDAKSISIKIPDEYKEETDFIVILIDNYKYEYEKAVVVDAKKGAKTVVTISKEDQTKVGHWFDKLFNGDM